MMTTALFGRRGTLPLAVGTVTGYDGAGHDR